MKRQLLSLFGLIAAISTWAGDYARYYEALPTQVKAVVKVEIPANVVNIKDCGGVGDGITLCTEAFEKGISKLSKMQLSILPTTWNSYVIPAEERYFPIHPHPLPSVLSAVLPAPRPE